MTETEVERWRACPGAEKLGLAFLEQSDLNSATLVKAALGRAVMWAESCFGEETSLVRLACLGPNSNVRRLFVLAEVLA